ncbi:MAG: peptidoglycan editing factor PgeF [Ruminococcus sp.]
MNFQSDTMTLHRGETPYLTFLRLSEIPFINHAFSTRLGGVSQGEFASMNLSFGRGDCDENVRENYKRICKAAGFSYESLTASAQVHEAVVRRVTAENRGVGIYKPKDMLSVDALVTNDPAVTLVTYYADCTPIFYVDTKTHAVALAHAGWRGTVKDIAGSVIRKMQTEFSTDPKDLVCAIGPVVGKCCYEVSEDCAEHFFELFGRNTSVVTKAEKEEKYMVDLALANKLLLLRTGVKEKNIVISDLCTNCSSDLLWSHRATGGKRGTMAAFLCMK